MVCMVYKICTNEVCTVVVFHFTGNTINFRELPKFHTVLGNISISLYFANPDSNYKKGVMCFLSPWRFWQFYFNSKLSHMSINLD